MRLNALATLLVCLVATAAWAQVPTTQQGMSERDAAGALPLPLAAKGKGWGSRRASPSADTHVTTPTPDPSPQGGEARGIPAPAEPTCIAERKLPIDPAAGLLHVGLKTYPRTLKLHDREIVLTFDDGPARETTPAVLAALKDACVHATFFLIGRHAAELPNLARQEMEEGHTTGHHSQTHPSFTLRGFDTASAERDIAAGIAADERAIYDEAAAPEAPHVPFFRFPGFADTPELLAYLDRRHIAVFGADLWAADWLDMSPEHELARVMSLIETTPHHNGILLFHDTRPSTARMLPYLLAELRARHYTIAHLVPAKAGKAPELTSPAKGWSSETERIIAHLRRPIVPGAHHAAEAADTVVAPGEGMGEAPAGDPRP